MIKLNSHEQRELAFRAYEYQFTTGSSWAATARHFEMPERKLHRYKHKYPYEELKEQFTITKNLRTHQITIEKRLPEGIKQKADESLEVMSQLTYNSAIILHRWVENIVEIINEPDEEKVNAKGEKYIVKGIDKIQLRDIDRLIRISGSTSPFVLPQGTGLDETNKTQRTELISQFENARVLLEKKEKENGKHKD